MRCSRYDPRLERVPRAGIVHRLDKDTSGLLVIARTPVAHTVLVRQLAAREVKREYLALCVGRLRSGGTVDAPIARHRVDRTRMTVRTGGREARTHYRVIERFRGHTLLRVALETGRTHQIRVHLAHLKVPIVGDPVYGGRLRLPRGATPELVAALQAFKRQALHAERLELEHPVTGKRDALERCRYPPTCRRSSTCCVPTRRALRERIHSSPGLAGARARARRPDIALWRREPRSLRVPQRRSARGR